MYMSCLTHCGLWTGSGRARPGHCAFVKNQGSSRNCVRAGDAEAASAWPVYQYGEAGYDRVKAMVDEDGLKGCAVVISEDSPAAG